MDVCDLVMDAWQALYRPCGVPATAEDALPTMWKSSFDKLGEAL